MDDPSLSARIKRYAQVTSTLTGLAARLAGEKYLNISIDAQSHADHLRNTLGQLKGPLMKVAQILAMVPDMLPPEYAQEFAQLQSNAPSMGGFFVRRRMTTELGAGWKESFSQFDEQAASAASLGQVHKAILKDGTQVACKLQYPDMASIVRADLEQLKLILSLYENVAQAILTQNMYAEIEERLYEELDYRREAKHIKLYAHMMRPYDYVHVPQVYPSLSTERLLTMDWLAGRSFKTCGDKPQAWREQVAERMFKAWYTPLYHYGVIHADPHMGNYTVTEDGQINLLDYGCIRIFSPAFVTGVIDLYRAFQQNDRELARHAYTQWGFQDMSEDLLDTLNLWAQFLYAPLLEDRVRPIQEGHTGVFGKEVADAVHSQLKALGGIAPPREFVFMDRAAVGMGSLLMQLKVEMNWHQLFEQLIADYHEQKLAERQQKAQVIAGLL